FLSRTRQIRQQGNRISVVDSVANAYFTSAATRVVTSAKAFVDATKRSIGAPPPPPSTAQTPLKFWAFSSVMAATRSSTLAPAGSPAPLTRTSITRPLSDFTHATGLRPARRQPPMSAHAPTRADRPA